MAKTKEQKKSVTRKKVYLPHWHRFVMIPMMLLIWALITYLEFFSEDNKEQLGTVGYIMMSILFLGLAVMFWLMTSGKLPAYIIEEEDKE